MVLELKCVLGLFLESQSYLRNSLGSQTATKALQRSPQLGTAPTGLWHVGTR